MTPEQMEFVGDSKLFLLGGDGLWMLDVKSDQMVLIKSGLTDFEQMVELTSSEDNLFFTRVAYPGRWQQLQLWESDGTADGTAMDGGGGEDNDYTAVSQMVVFPKNTAGPQTMMVNVPVGRDDKLELDETFTISLSSPMHGAIEVAGYEAVVGRGRAITRE